MLFVGGFAETRSYPLTDNPVDMDDKRKGRPNVKATASPPHIWPDAQIKGNSSWSGNTKASTRTASRAQSQPVSQPAPLLWRVGPPPAAPPYAASPLNLPAADGSGACSSHTCQLRTTRAGARVWACGPFLVLWVNYHLGFWPRKHAGYLRVTAQHRPLPPPSLCSRRTRLHRGPPRCL